MYNIYYRNWKYQ